MTYQGLSTKGTVYWKFGVICKVFIYKYIHSSSFRAIVDIHRYRHTTGNHKSSVWALCFKVL